MLFIVVEKCERKVGLRRIVRNLVFFEMFNGYFVGDIKQVFVFMSQSLGRNYQEIKNNNKIYICRLFKVIRSDDLIRSDGGRKREKILELILGILKLKVGGNNVIENIKLQKQKEIQGSLMICKLRKRVFLVGRIDKLLNVVDKLGQMRIEIWLLD